MADLGQQYEVVSRVAGNFSYLSTHTFFSVSPFGEEAGDRWYPRRRAVLTGEYGVCIDSRITTNSLRRGGNTAAANAGVSTGARREL
jgi:hypothetical protein